LLHRQLPSASATRSREETLNTKYGKVTLTSTTLSAILLCASAAPARADEDRSKCQHHIEKAEEKLERAVSRHGERSAQAREAREHLNAERRECWGHHHAWYEAHERRWHTEQDWDHDEHR